MDDIHGLKYALKRIVYVAHHTPYGREGKVLGVMLFGGDGYMWRPYFKNQNKGWRNLLTRLIYINMSGLTIYIRVKGKRNPAKRYPNGSPRNSFRFVTVDWCAPNYKKHDLF